MSAGLPQIDPRARSARRDVLALVTAYVDVADDAAVPVDHPVRVLLGEVCAEADFSVPYLLAITGALLTELAECGGTTPEDLWQSRATRLAVGHDR